MDAQVNGMPAAARPPRNGKARFHELDALRAFAMLLGIALHAFLFLIPQAWPFQDPWAATTPVEENAYLVVFFLIHGFRMPVFFLLSGFFTALLWQRRGLRALAGNRLQRLGLPLLLGALTIVPLNAWLFSPDDFAWFYWPFVWLSPEMGFNHLWFLWQLLLLIAVFAGLVRLGATFTHPVAWWGLVPLTLLPQYFMSEESFGPDTSVWLVPDGRVLGFYALFFGFGAFLHQRRIAVRRWWSAALLPALAVAYPAGIAFLFFVESEQAQAWAAVCQAAYAWCMCFGLLGLFRWIASGERRWVRYVSDASYWLYLWHLPLILVLQRWMVAWPFNVHGKFALMCAVTTGVLLLLYQAGVRYTWVGAMLNGPRVRLRMAPASAASRA